MFVNKEKYLTYPLAGLGLHVPDDVSEHEQEPSLAGACTPPITYTGQVLLEKLNQLYIPNNFSFLFEHFKRSQSLSI